MIKKSNIDKMLEMPDDRLWSMLKIIMTGMGIDMSSKKYDPKTVKKIRCVLEEITDEDIDRVTYLTERYKYGG